MGDAKEWVFAYYAKKHVINQEKPCWTMHLALYPPHLYSFDSWSAVPIFVRMLKVQPKFFYICFRGYLPSAISLSLVFYLWTLIFSSVPCHILSINRVQTVTIYATLSPHLFKVGRKIQDRLAHLNHLRKYRCEIHLQAFKATQKQYFTESKVWGYKCELLATSASTIRVQREPRHLSRQ